MTRRPAILAERRWIALTALVALALGQAVTMVVTAFATRDVVMHLRDQEPSAPTGALLALAASGIALCLFRSLEGRVGEGAGQSYVAALRKTLFLHVTRMPSSDIAQRRSGALALRYVGDLAAFKGWIARGLARLISAGITLPAAGLILFWLDPRLLLAASGPIGAGLFGIWMLSHPLGQAHARLRSKRARLAASMAERLPQGIALRRSGRVAVELRALRAQSQAVARAGIHREWLAATVRALPDACAGLAGALCLWVCIQRNLGVPEAVATLTALAMIVWPLRHLADVADRRRAYLVAADKLDRLLAAPRLPAPSKTQGTATANAIDIKGVVLPDCASFDLSLARGEMRRLAGASGSGKTALLLALAGLDRPPKAARFSTCGAKPGGLYTGRVLFLGRRSPALRGSLRRDVSLGVGRSPDDGEITAALTQAGLSDLMHRIGGLSGRIDEGRRNLTATEQARLLLARALLARPDLALIDADEVGLDRDALTRLLAHLREVGAAALVVTSHPEGAVMLGPAISLSAPGVPAPSARDGHVSEGRRLPAPAGAA